MKSNSLIPYKGSSLSVDEMERHAKDFYAFMNTRRTVRDFSSRDIPKDVIRNLILAASSAPSGAHKQPWVFCAISEKSIKRKIREAAEKEEYLNYHGRMSEAWLKDLEFLGTDWNKPFLEIAPWLIVVFKKPYELINGEQRKNYYVNESVGLACGLLLTAIHRAGLVALTHTPSPMNFLERILNRPSNERAYLLVPMGWPATDAMVPDIERKSEEDVLFFYEDP
ncbi:MAG: nitroreductase family protein [Saprospiraceae bacterium]|nr:nitroreductase family protein [Saprospiraceae bacterium]